MGMFDCVKKMFKEEEAVIEKVPHRGIVSRVGGYSDIGLQFTLHGDRRIFIMYSARWESLMQKGDEVGFTICTKEESGKRVHYFTDFINLTLQAENYDYSQALTKRF